MRKIIALAVIPIYIFASQLITPIPDKIAYDVQKAQLGKKLFFDTRLSKDDTISCASCHSLESGGVDGLKFSFGIEGKEGGINAPTVLNAVFNLSQFWDGRAKDLKDQAMGPIINPVEMGSSYEEVINKLNKDSEYKDAFEKIYNRPIHIDDVADAIAEYEKTLITPNSKFDRYLEGDVNALSEDEKEGYELFKNLGCISCHNGVNIGGNIYQKFGIFKERPSEISKGRFGVTENPEDMFYFKVPTLRNISKTAPYFHDGSAENLREAISVMAEHQLGRKITKEQIEKLYLFLLTLEGQIQGEVK